MDQLRLRAFGGSANHANTSHRRRCWGRRSSTDAPLRPPGRRALLCAGSYRRKGQRRDDRSGGRKIASQLLGSRTSKLRRTDRHPEVPAARRWLVCISSLRDPAQNARIGSMKLTINGEPQDSSAQALGALVEQLEMKPDRVAIELNREI